MILFLGNEKYRSFIEEQGAQLKEDIPVEEADKLIVTAGTKAAAEAVSKAVSAGKPVLGILDGYKAVALAFGGEVAEISCDEGAQEWAVIDATSPVYVELESVIKVARGKPYALTDENRPAMLDCMSRSEAGDIIAIRAFKQPSEGEVVASKPKEYDNVFALNFDLMSPLTPDGKTIIGNFLKM